MAAALRGVMKTGRRYKPPRVAPTLHLHGEVFSHPDVVQKELGLHFAAPENGQPSNLRDIVKHGHHDANAFSEVDITQLPSLPSLAFAFMSRRHNKAVGLSCIPTEAYSANAIMCAALRMPLIAKIAATGVAPSLWRGAQAIASAKPGKPPTSLSGWRSIALYDAAAKDLGKALRKQLSASLRTHVADGQHASLPGDALPLPAHCVQSYLSAASTRNQSCAILFLDGKAAYYALIR